MVWRWSKTAASNSNADSTINWAEGQAPSSINDSARAEMARVAQWRDDISGAIVTGGSGTAYTVSSNQVFDTLTNLDGAMIAFTPHTANTAAATLNVDALGAKPLRFSPSVDLPSNSLLQGTPYVATYNNTDGVWYLQNTFFSNPYNVPLASGIDYWADTAPNSAFVFPVGQNISRTTYATLFAKIGTTYGSGDGSTTFGLPNKVERVSVMKSSTPNLLTPAFLGWNSSVLGATGGSQSHTLAVDQMPSHTHANVLNDSGHFHGAFDGNSFITNSGAAVLSGNSTAAWNTTSRTSTAFTGMTITNASAGSNNPHPIVQPTIVCNYIMRII